MENIVNLIMSNGLGVVLVGYFIFKDYKFNEQIITVLGEMKEVLTAWKTFHGMNDSEG